MPVRIKATSDARCPSVCPLASTTYHFRLPASSFPLGKYVDIVNYLCFQRIKRERLEYRWVKKIVKKRTLDRIAKISTINKICTKGKDRLISKPVLLILRVL